MANNTGLREKVAKIISQDGWVDTQEVDVEGETDAIIALIEAEATRRSKAEYKRGYSNGYNAGTNKEINQYGHRHEWSISPNQDDTGTAGVRKVCSICGLEMSVYDPKLHAELKRQAEGGK